MEIDLLLKIGGSSISNKMLLYKALKSKNPDDLKQAVNIDVKAIKQIIKEIKSIYNPNKRMVILTGVGAPGHFTVLKHSLHKGNLGTFEQHVGLLEAQIAVNRLRQNVLEAFLENSIPAVQVYASSIYASDKMRIVRGCTENIIEFLNQGMVPIISGDMVPDKTMGYSVLSGDQIIADLVGKLRPKKIIYGSDVDGLFENDPKVHPDSKFISQVSIDEIEDIANKLVSADASGQMKGKLMEIKNLLQSGVKEVFLLNLKREGILSSVLKGEEIKFTRFYV
ncbi:MAG: isopentenyl phosphate kinase [Candidatus Hodarchaeales archaeon]